ncbi:hypothetical protein MgSA37_02655 [Mucilaginibacter gotjawali]|uniref:Uncharacterized protein n=1 Tax=Mucilaginibacter gotjawali TaxID=1550579 RepID=A0A0X8X2D7_9SPHI|nr:hypothetical protein MgSA37_02655 [Mucilaginibacter gotjawali]
MLTPKRQRCFINLLYEIYDYYVTSGDFFLTFVKTPYNFLNTDNKGFNCKQPVLINEIVKKSGSQTMVANSFTYRHYGLLLFFKFFALN